MSSDNGGFVHGRQSISTTERAGRPGVRLALREVNDRIAELTEWNETGVSLFVCECSDSSCADALEISSAEYVRLRAEESYFVVFPGHERPDSDEIVDRNGRFVVVAQRGREDRDGD